MRNTIDSDEEEGGRPELLDGVDGEAPLDDEILCKFSAVLFRQHCCVRLDCLLTVFEFACLCSNFSWNLISSFLVLANLLGPVAKNFARRLVCPGWTSMTYLPAVHFVNTRKYPLMSPIHLAISPLCTSPPWFYTSHFVSFRCQIHRYDHAASTLICTSIHMLTSAHTCARCYQGAARQCYPDVA